MGNEITTDKHTTQIQQWFQVSSKLESIDFNTQINNHIGIWRVFQDQKNKQQFNVVPVLIEAQSLSMGPLFTDNQCYIVYGIKKALYQNPQISCSNLGSQLDVCLSKIKANMIKNTYQTPMKCFNFEGNECKLYAYFGKKSKSKAKLLATSYCLRLGNVLNSKKKLGIISGGGVLRNKKLQKGSKLSLSWSDNSKNGNPSILKHTSHSDIDIIRFFQEDSHHQKNYKRSKIFSHKSKTPLPVFKQVNQRKIQVKNPSSNASSMSNSSINNQSIHQAQTGFKKPMIEKMNLKLDFSKPLSSLVKSKSSSVNNPSSESNQGSLNQIDNLGIGLTNRSQQRRGKRQKCNQQCSLILQGLYVSGQKVAKNKQILQKHNISAIINCAGDYCENWFQNQGKIQYLTFFLKDSQNQNIECLFYRVIDFIQNCHKQKKNVLIHCIQGISRSITFIIAYIMFKYGFDYKKSETFVKQKRLVACPNNGFMVELIQFHKRLYDQYECLPQPRVYLVSSHSKQTPQIYTARMLKLPLFDEKKWIGLDSRGAYVIHTKQVIYVWVGSKCQDKKLQNYWTFANDFIKKLQKYQRAPITVKAISEGSENQQFLDIWGLKTNPRLYQNPQYNRFFCEGETAKPGQLRQYYQQVEEQDQQNQAQRNINKLFIYPDYKQGLGVYSQQDLTGLCILSRVQTKQGKVTLHIWKQQGFRPSNQSQNDQNDEQYDEEFLKNVIEINFSQFDQNLIEIIQEQLGNQSLQFKQCIGG